MLKTITPFLSIIIALVVFFTFIRPTYSHVTELKAQTDEYAKAIEKADESNQALAQLINTKRGHTSEDMERLEQLVPEDIDEVQVLVDLKELAKEHNMLLGNITVEEGDASTGSAGTDASQNNAVSATSFITSDISFGVIGSYEQFKSFLTDIERSLTLMEVTSVQFSGNEGELQQYSVSVRLYGLPPLK